MTADAFADLFGELGRHADGTPKVVTVETFEGRGMSGERWAAPVTLSGIPQTGGTRLVRSSTGDERLSTAALYAVPDDGEHFPVGSRVVLDGGRRSTVLERTLHDAEDLTTFYEIRVE